jgi:iron only hydrogenase large subunit-like protein
MDSFYSVRLVEDKCRGCTACLKRCPVEAIRVYDGKAHILHERCIDCGECIRTCTSHAKIALTDNLSDIHRFAFPVALPAPTLYGQFRNSTMPGEVRAALLRMGFSMVFDVARGADLLTKAVKAQLDLADRPRPMISSACPAVTRLIQTRFPSLLDNLIPLRQPMEVAAQMARRQAAQEYGACPEDIGIFFITPCPAKMTAIRKPLGHETSQVDGAVSMMEVFSHIKPLLGNCPPDTGPSPFSREGLCWAASGGEIAAVGPHNSISVDGIDQVIQVLEEVENRSIDGLDYIEALACPGGCIGGPLVYENAYRARNTLEQIRAALPESPGIAPAEQLPAEAVYFDQPLQANDSMKLHESIQGAMERLEEINRLVERLPGYDCGSCGSPTCRSFAEDIVRGLFNETDCIYVLKDTLKGLAQTMVDLAKTRRE